jgi:hypothetical protein
MATQGGAGGFTVILTGAAAQMPADAEIVTSVMASTAVV